MNRPSDWIMNRRWLWRLILLLIVLAVILALLVNGRDLLGALTATFLIFLLAAHVSRWFIDDAPPPSLPTMLFGQIDQRGPSDPAAAAPTDQEQSSSDDSPEGHTPWA